MEDHVAAGNVDAYHDAADQLHEALHTMAGNPWLLRATADLRRFLRLARGMARQSDGRLLQSLAEHRTLMKTMSRGDAESAEQVMHHHLMAQQKNWRAAHQNPPHAPAPEAGETATESEPVPPVGEESDTPAKPGLPDTRSAAAKGDAGSAAPAGRAHRLTATANQHAEAESLGV
jgi:hypothetical protein